MDERRTVKALEIAPAWTALQLSTPNGVTDSTLLAVQSQLDLFCMIHCSSHASATLHSGATGRRAFAAEASPCCLTTGGTN